jgi:Ca-activated chloride channel family protein
MMNTGHFHFAEPGWLWLALAGPALLAWLYAHAAGGRAEQLARMASPHFVKELTSSHSPARRYWKNVLVTVAVALAAIALARPQWGSVESGDARLSEDVMFVLDCSLSMTATDVLPSRMQRAKFAMLDFVQQQSHGRVGLVAFAGSAFTQCPLTFDTDAFEETLQAVDEKTIPNPGTDIGRALIEANHAMDKGSHRKLIVLMTDGEDLETSGVAVARRLATNGVVIFTIGVGTADGKEIQIVNAAGQPEWVRDDKGEIVRSHLDEATLKQIAETTGGSYFPLGPLGQGLARIRPAIQALESRDDRRQVERSGVERFYLPVALMLGLLVTESLMGTRRKEHHAAS